VHAQYASVQRILAFHGPHRSRPRSHSSLWVSGLEGHLNGACKVDSLKPRTCIHVGARRAQIPTVLLFSLLLLSTARLALTRLARLLFTSLFLFTAPIARGLALTRLALFPPASRVVHLSLSLQFTLSFRSLLLFFAARLALTRLALFPPASRVVLPLHISGNACPEPHLQPCTADGRYRCTSLIRNSAPLEPYSRNMPRTLWWSWGGGLFLMSEVPLYNLASVGALRAQIPTVSVLAQRRGGPPRVMQREVCCQSLPSEEGTTEKVLRAFT